MRNKFILLSFMLCTVVPATAQISIGVELPHVSIGVNLPVYPDLVPVPGYPVYYAPRLDSNYFFYDGMYWVYEDDNWYASSWYNGPWDEVDREVVPAFVLRIPVRYYRHQPAYFRGWRADAPPRWNEHWGHDWAQQRNGWDRWDHKATPARPPLPVYQRSFSGDKYPRPEQQRALENKNYKYQPHDPAVRQQHDSPRVTNTPARAQPTARPAENNRQRENGQQRNDQQRQPTDRQRAAPPTQQNAPVPAPREQPPQRDRQSAQPKNDQPRQADTPRQAPAAPHPAPAVQQQRREAAPQGNPAAPEPQQRQQPRQQEPRNQQPAPESRGRETAPEQRQGQREERGKTGENRGDKPDDRGR